MAEQTTSRGISSVCKHGVDTVTIELIRGVQEGKGFVFNEPWRIVTYKHLFPGF